MTVTWRRATLIAATLALLGGCGTTASGASKATVVVAPAATRAEGDVLVRRCDLSWPRASAQGTVTNSSTQQADYTIAINFVDVGDTVVGQNTTDLSNIEPGQEASWQVTSTLNNAAGKVDCKAAKVTRTPTR